MGVVSRTGGGCPKRWERSGLRSRQGPGGSHDCPPPPQGPLIKWGAGVRGQNRLCASLHADREDSLQPKLKCLQLRQR